MNTHLRNFSTYTEYAAAKGDGTIDELHVAHADNNDTCYFSKLEILPKGPESTPGTIHMYNATTGIYKTVYRDTYTSQYKDDSNWTPVGIVVIPKTHDVYGTGEGALISLQEMSYSTPDTGTNSSRQYMMWGKHGELSGLVQRNLISCLGHDEDGAWTPDNELDHVGTYGYLPSDKLSTENWTLQIYNPYDSDAEISTTWRYNDSNHHIASPYLNNNDRNPLYYEEGELYENYIFNKLVFTLNCAGYSGNTVEECVANSDYDTLEELLQDGEGVASEEEFYDMYGIGEINHTGNMLGDFAGKANTEYLNAQNDTKLSGWKTLAALTNSQDYYPAAACCWRYSVAGTEQGDWYLPAAGELGYMMARFHQIQLSLTALGALTIGTSSDCWSSTEYSSSSAVCLHTDGGGIYGGNKGSGRCVRAFCRF